MAILKCTMAAVLAACSAMAADSGLLSLVAPDAKVITGIHVDRSLASPLGQYLWNQMETDKSFGSIRKTLQAAGFDPRRDLNEVIAATSDPQKKSEGLVIARGTFDMSKLTAMARVSGGTVTNYKDVQVIDGKHDSWVAFLDARTIAVGQADAVKAAIDRRGRAMEIDPKFASKVTEVSGKYDIWMASIAPVSSFAGKLPDARMNGALTGEMVQGIEQASGGVTLGATVRVSGDAVLRSEKDATALADVVKFLASMVQVNRDKPDAAKLAAIVDTLDLRASANTLSISFSVPSADLEQMMRPRATRNAVRKVAVQR